jgi:hypothetical protein
MAREPYGATTRSSACAPGSRLNEGNGIVSSATGGYHETVTRAYVQLLRLRRSPRRQRRPRNASSLCSPIRSRTSALLRFYSRPRLESSEARLGWVDPDLAPLP